ncbi:MAG TPA: alpha/beta hydrolase [Woeseiaceae bacterium]|nr:alpha/beta hydrolase [Woeseiaceae bacterium]
MQRFTGAVALLGLIVTAPSAGSDLQRRAGAADETHPGIVTTYGSLDVAGRVELRTILTRPEGVQKPPVIQFVQWLSCDTVEIGPDAADGWSQMLRGMVRNSGFAIMRTDKRGVGDSGGGPCSALDYVTELSDQRAALAALSARDDVDTSRIVVFGASMGSRMAGQVAAGAPGVVGVLGWGGGSKTWFERMLAFDRNAMERGGTAAGEIATRMREHSAFHARYLLEGRDPPDIIAADPAMAAVWAGVVGTSATDHYGRPFAFHQQAQQADFTAAWGEIGVPVLMVMGEYDWFENRAGHETVVHIVNRNGAGLARFEEIPRMDHHFTLFDSAEAAFRGAGGRADAGPFLRVALAWLKALRVPPEPAAAPPAGTP